MKIIYVSAGVLENKERKIFIVQRPAKKDMAGLWEFPGGKIETGESPEQTLQRELFEELGININLKDLKPLCFVSHQYENFQLLMLVFQCYQWQGEITLREGQQNSQWVLPIQLKDFPMPPADLPIFDYL